MPERVRVSLLPDRPEKLLSGLSPTAHVPVYVRPSRSVGWERVVVIVGALTPRMRTNPASCVAGESIPDDVETLPDVALISIYCPLPLPGRKTVP